ncbi:hypothetical protein SUGI_0717420 [Cryptomeria japonica]|nr:hypothetical protein SUGI_0717420 [Cryptomeria japonica]
MVFTKMVSAAVQEMAMLLNRLIPQNPIPDVLRAFLWCAHRLVGAKVISFWNWSTLPILLIFMKMLRRQVWCQEMNVKHFASETALAKLFFSGDKFYNSTAYIKIQSTSKRFKSIVVIIICVSVGGAVALFILFWARIKGSQNRRQQKVKDEDAGEDDVDWSAGLPLRFSFQELQDTTNGFSIKLGSRGFGSVYQGVLSDGSKIAVKRLHRAGHGEKGFRPEVETLGKIDHLNLAEEGRLLDLVYPGLENEETGIKEEAIKLIKVGMWCVQDNFTRRPAMSIVVKALEGLIDTFNDVPCALPGSTVGSYKQSLFSAELSVLSGPR